MSQPPTIPGQAGDREDTRALLANNNPLSVALASPAGYAMHVDPLYKMAPHLELLNERLVALATGRIRRLIVQMPPRHGKSMLCSQYFPAWFLALWPDKRVILSAYEATFAASWGRKTRDLYTEFNDALFDKRVRKDTRAAAGWYIDKHRGAMYTAGVGGPITGKGADLFIIDDPVKNAEDALSKTKRRSAWEWYVSTARTRIEPGGSMLLIMTRWHEDDLAGKIIEANKDVDPEDPEYWHVLSLPALAEEDDPLGRAPGEPLWPERYDEKALATLRRELGTYWFTALFQQRPTPEEGGLFKKKWFREYTTYGSRLQFGPEYTLSIEKKHLEVFTVSDLALTTKDHSDYTAISVWGAHRATNSIFLLDMLRTKLEGPDILPAIRTMGRKHDARIHYIEKAVNSLALIQQGQRHGMPIRELIADKDKFTRALSATPAFEAGHVFFPLDAHWLPKYLEELLQFPNATHDDQVDVTAYAIAYCHQMYQASRGAPRLEKRVRQLPSGFAPHAPQRLFG